MSPPRIQREPFEPGPGRVDPDRLGDQEKPKSKAEAKEWSLAKWRAVLAEYPDFENMKFEEARHLCGFCGWYEVRTTEVCRRAVEGNEGRGERCPLFDKTCGPTCKWACALYWRIRRTLVHGRPVAGLLQMLQAMVRRIEEVEV